MRYIDADKLLEVLNGFTQFHHIEKLTVGTLIDMIADIPTAEVREDSLAIGKDNRYLDLTKVYEYFRSKEITELKFYDNDIVHEFKMVVRGEWKIKTINTFDMAYGATAYEPVYECSVCGGVEESYLRLDEPIMPEDADFPNYCPNCGAEMRGVEDDS